MTDVEDYDCKFCQAAWREFRHVMNPHVFTVVVDGEEREVMLRSPLVHVSCDREVVDAAKSQGATLWPRERNKR